MFHSNSSRCVWLQVCHLHNSSSKCEWLLECLHLSSSNALPLEFSSKCNFPQEYHHSSTRQCFSNKQQQQRNSNALPLALIRSSSSKFGSLQGFLLSSTRRC